MYDTWVPGPGVPRAGQPVVWSYGFLSQSSTSRSASSLVWP